MFVNNNFSLFSSGKEDAAATTDELLLIFPYIVLKAKITRLLRHVRFIEIFDLKNQISGERAFVFNKLKVSIKIIEEFDENTL